VATRVAVGVFAGLLLGKPLGVLLASAAAVKTRLAVLPRGVGARELALLGLVAGVGFTMAIFISDLAFPDEALLHAAKGAVLLASTCASVATLVAGRLLLPAGPRGGTRIAPEAST
ncbi:MAG TPA: Na+/H+ antiporter NhaA, partial [Minicystis sp.]|nr:Na+/H+ antiporter NhaA [Minicystis sp.]